MRKRLSTESPGDRGRTQFSLVQRLRELTAEEPDAPLYTHVGSTAANGC